jgi:hypothetical protein
VNRYRVGPPTSAGLVIVGLLLGLAVGVAIGARLAAPAAPAAMPGPTLLDVEPDAVSQRLRDAFYSAGGSTQVCVAAATVVCKAAVRMQSARRYNDTSTPLDATDRAGLKPVHVPMGRIIVAGDFGPVDGATISRLESSRPVDGRMIVAANPERQGIDYVDLGDLQLGTYLVALYIPSLLTPTMLIEVVVE